LGARNFEQENNFMRCLGVEEFHTKFARH